jgi:hypothetical protein
MFDAFDSYNTRSLAGLAQRGGIKVAVGNSVIVKKYGFQELSVRDALE